MARGVREALRTFMSLALLAKEWREKYRWQNTTAVAMVS
jgi:hypothetical protein